MVTKQQTRVAIEKAIQLLFILSFLLGLAPAGIPAHAEQGTNLPKVLAQARTRVYLPLIRNGSSSDLPLMTGVYPEGWPSVDTINNEMKPLDNWLTGITGGRSTSIFGTFLNLNVTDSIAKPNVEDPLTVIWNAGYTPFVNLPALSGATAYDVATSSVYDRMITSWAKSFKNFANGGTRFAYIAPLQEMNGEWVTYGKDPANFILAYKRFRAIFTREGVPAQSVKWVFAPNGWSKASLPQFEAYYPGDEFVDVVAISAYNFGYCNGGVWEEPDTVFNNPNGHYLDRLRALAPSKPIFIAQTASSSYKTAGAPNAAEKERWLSDAYKYLSTQQNVRAVIYFNIVKECDWAIFKSGVQNLGYKTAINSNGYKYISPSELITTDHLFK